MELARERVPEGRFDVGDVQALPYEDGSFDVITAFNSLQFVPDPAMALSEARRVSKPGAILYILVWGREENTQLVAVMKALHPLVPPRPPGGPGAFALSPPGILEELVAGSGFTPRESGYVATPYEYPDEATMLRAQRSSAPAVLAARTSGDEAVERALVEALSPFRTGSGGYRIETEYRYVTAVAG